MGYGNDHEVRCDFPVRGGLGVSFSPVLIQAKKCNVNVNVNAFFIVEVHLAIKLVYRYSTVNKVKVTIGKLNRNILRTPTGGKQPVGYLQSMVELNPGQPETNPNQRL